TWDEELERSAAAWAEECLWEHGPANLLVSIGQNLAVHWGRGQGSLSLRTEPLRGLAFPVAAGSMLSS
ncbi:Hypothetical predicted protein, partial [Marmota monax]